MIILKLGAFCKPNCFQNVRFAPPPLQHTLLFLSVVCSFLFNSDSEHPNCFLSYYLSSAIGFERPCFFELIIFDTFMCCFLPTPPDSYTNVVRAFMSFSSDICNWESGCIYIEICICMCGTHSDQSFLLIYLVCNTSVFYAIIQAVSVYLNSFFIWPIHCNTFGWGVTSDA